jgi:hypothetical protein
MCPLSTQSSFLNRHITPAHAFLRTPAGVRTLAATHALTSAQKQKSTTGLVTTAPKSYASSRRSAPKACATSGVQTSLARPCTAMPACTTRALAPGGSLHGGRMGAWQVGRERQAGTRGAGHVWRVEANACIHAMLAHVRAHVPGCQYTYCTTLRNHVHKPGPHRTPPKPCPSPPRVAKHSHTMPQVCEASLQGRNGTQRKAAIRTGWEWWTAPAARKWQPRPGRW